MTRPLRTITEEALTLDEAERLQLAADLIDSVEGPADPTWAAAWADELRQRSEAADLREVRGISWPEVRSRLLRGMASE